jgi:hypothetical protein
MLPNPEWCAWDSRNQQHVFLCDFTKNECFITLPALTVTQMFNTQDSNVWKIQLKAQNKSKP